MSEITGSPDDFDFLPGTWTLANRRLKQALVGGDEWDCFGGQLVNWKLFEGTPGAGNIDEMRFPERGSSGITLRLFDPETQQWTISCSSSRAPRPDPNPVRGGFADGVGLFYTDDTYEGQPIRLRYKWCDITDTSARWEQAFSPDGGQTWETNWTMDLTRTS